MAGNADDLDLDQNDEDEDEQDESKDKSGEEKPPEGEVKDDKRVNDLTSQRDKETARANKAEAALAKLVARDEGTGSGSSDPERAALLQELREASLDAVYSEYEELRAYNIDRSLVDGRTRAEMRESATALVGLIKNVETKARNKALRDAGVKADPLGSTRQPPKDYAAMSEEEFAKEVERAKLRR